MNSIISNLHVGWLINAKASDDGKYFIGNKRWNICVEYNPNPTFKLHKFLTESESGIILFDGVVLNQDDLFKRYDVKKWDSVIYSLYEEFGVDFPAHIEGSFNGFIIDNKNKRMVCFSDHVGSKAVFYQCGENEITISSDVTKIFDLNIKSGRKNILDINSAYALLSCGFMIDNNTLCSHVKRLTPGCLLDISTFLQEHVFYNLSNVADNSIKEDEAIEMVDQLFIKAVKDQFENDMVTESHLVALSGGLDSRMTSLIGHKLGYCNQLNITFSQSNYLDETIASAIASDYNHDWMFKSLDSGKYLLDVDDITEFTGGGVLYYGIAHGNSLSKFMDFSRFGILHSGQLGDVIIGTYYSTNNPNKPYSLDSKSFGSTLLSKVDIKNIREYPNEEIGIYYNRGYNGVLYAGGVLTQQRIETLSPFTHKGFMDYCLKLPLNYRRNHRLYKKWILKKHPDIAVYPWEKIKARIDSPSISLFGKSVPLSTLPSKVCNAFKYHLLKADPLNNKRHMNPIGYHIANNDEVSGFITNYYNENIDLVVDAELRKDIDNLNNTNSPIERIMLISLLSAIKRFRLE